MIRLTGVIRKADEINRRRNHADISKESRSCDWKAGKEERDANKEQREADEAYKKELKKKKK